ncbi:MAG TPA: hypothetical protein VFK69_13150, partial [Candidatus Eisenbacteria bacterium]|nr:hypothetical protein [Candidatus Eisenbacteria bacterium]
ISDGAHGLYSAYSGANSTVALHLGPANTGVGGWTSARALVAQDPDAPYTMWPGIALAPDGGVFVACASYGFDPDLIAFTPGHLRVRRLTADGLSYAGWDDAGIDEGAFDRSLFGAASPHSSLIAAAPDGAGGVFFLLGSPTGTDQGYPTLQTRLLELGGDGLPALGAPAGGVVVNEAPTYYLDGGLDASYELRPASPGTVFAGFPAYYTDAPAQYMYSLCSASGGGWGIQGDAVGHEAATTMGAIYLATFHPTGPYGPYDPPAFIALGSYDGGKSTGLLSEYHNDILQHWYGDIGLAATNDGEAVFFWSQENQKYGLFARKFNAAGQVAAAPSAARDPGVLSDVRFERGIGVRATVRLDAGERGRLALFDVQGRTIAGTTVVGTGAPATLHLPESDTIPVGVYFLRLKSPARSGSTRVAVVH